MKTLKNILLLNAVSSGATGILLVLGAPFIANLFAVTGSAVFYATGIFLLVFAGFVFYESRQDPIRPDRVLFISVLDSAWVLVSFTIVFLGLFNLSVLGYCLISAVAIWVAAMAYFQSKSIKKIAF